VRRARLRLRLSIVSIAALNSPICNHIFGCREQIRVGTFACPIVLNVIRRQWLASVIQIKCCPQISPGPGPEVMNLKYQWQKPYTAALTETDVFRLRNRIETAHGAIESRILELDRAYMVASEERAAIEFAVHCLEILRRGANGPRRIAS